MFRNLIRELADEYNIIAPDYPGFGNSDQPPIDEFEYTFDNLANVINNFVEEIKLDKYTIYVHNYGAPVGDLRTVPTPLMKPPFTPRLDIDNQYTKFD
jgi:pimeloyl-ACP methyl ester carboxylesterase